MPNNPTAKTPSEIAAAWLAGFEAALAKGDAVAATRMFAEECYWRDLVSFTWNILTLEGRASIEAMLKSTLSRVAPSNWRLEGEATEADGVTQAWFTFETAVSHGKGLLRLKDGKAWTLLTTMVSLKGHEEPAGTRRVAGVEHGVQKGRKNWAELRAEEEAELGYRTQPYCLIIGGGQGGIALGARLRRLGVPTIIVEKNARPGDSWRKRYKTLCLHDPVWYDHLPYLPFPDHWPVFSPKDKIADWLEAYTKLMELNNWGSTECKRASYDEVKQGWTVEVMRDGKPVTLRPKQLVLATGMSAVPNVPEFPGAETFEGEQHHSSHHPGPDAYAGKKCVVIGSNNSAHDICAALWEAGADVTMVQRSSTLVAKSRTLMEVTTYPLWGEEALANGIDHNKADLIAASVPYKLMPDFHRPMWVTIAERDADLYARLRKAGFMLDFGEDESGLFMKYLRRGSGYYIDVGASDLIADGKIKLKSGAGAAVKRIKEHSVELADGPELLADLIVYATGYGSMHGWASQLISPGVGEKVGQCWGLGSGTTKDPGPWQGELRNMWKPTRQAGLWFHGGNLHQSRHYSQFLALQLKARAAGIATVVYG